MVTTDSVSTQGLHWCSTLYPAVGKGKGKEPDDGDQMREWAI